MYLYASEHAIMDYHLNEDKKTKEAEQPPKETQPDNGANISNTK